MVSEPGSGTAEFFPDSSVGKPEASDLGSAPASATTTYTGSPRNPFSTVTCTDGPRNLSTTRLGSSWNPLSTTLHREGSGSWNPPTIPGQDSPRNLSTTPGGSPRNLPPPKGQNDDAGSTQPKIGKLGNVPDAKINVESLSPMHIEADNKLLTQADVGYAPVEELCTKQIEASNTIFQVAEADVKTEEPESGPMHITPTPHYYILTTPGFPTMYVKKVDLNVSIFDPKSSQIPRYFSPPPITPEDIQESTEKWQNYPPLPKTPSLSPWNTAKSSRVDVNKQNSFPSLDQDLIHFFSQNQIDNPENSLVPTVLAACGRTFSSNNNFSLFQPSQASVLSENVPTEENPSQTATKVLNRPRSIFWPSLEMQKPENNASDEKGALDEVNLASQTQFSFLKQHKFKRFLKSTSAINSPSQNTENKTQKYTSVDNLTLFTAFESDLFHRRPELYQIPLSSSGSEAKSKFSNPLIESAESWEYPVSFLIPFLTPPKKKQADDQEIQNESKSSILNPLPRLTAGMDPLSLPKTTPNPPIKINRMPCSSRKNMRSWSGFENKADASPVNDV